MLRKSKQTKQKTKLKKKSVVQKCKIDPKNIKKTQKVEEILKREILKELDKLEEGQEVMLKLTLPTVADFYKELVDHKRVVRVVALSGGYSREESNELLAKNHGVIASFSRALTEGLNVNQTGEEFDKMLDSSIQSIFEASRK